MIRAIKEYICAIYADWISLISGIFSVILTFWAIYINAKTDWQVWYWFIASFVAYVIASFRVWYKYRPQLLIEREDDYIFLIRYEKPKITFITCQILFTNTKTEKNTIKRSRLIVYSDSGEQEGEMKFPPYYIDQRGNRNSLIGSIPIFTQGEPIPYNFSFRFEGETDLLTKSFDLYLTDSYNATYKISGVIPLDIKFRITEEKEQNKSKVRQISSGIDGFSATDWK